MRCAKYTQNTLSSFHIQIGHWKEPTTMCLNRKVWIDIRVAFSFLSDFSFSREKKRVHRRNQWSNLNILRKWCHESTRNYKMENKLSYSMWIYSSDGYSYIPRFHRNAFPGKQCKIWNWATNASWTVRSMVELQPIVCDIAYFLGHSNL